MTTTVKVEAHCGMDTEVLVTLFDADDSREVVLQDGEKFEEYVYDNRIITVAEYLKIENE